jgi:hypothetical protein
VQVEGRTGAPAWAVAALWSLLSYALLVAVRKAAPEEWVPLMFAMSTVLAVGYALVAFVGLQNGRADIRHGWGAFRSGLSRRLGRHDPRLLPISGLEAPGGGQPQPMNPSPVHDGSLR